MNRLSQYFSGLSTSLGESWNRFWFTPSDSLPLGVLRIGAGLFGLYYLYSHTADLIRWFGPHGLLPASAVRDLTSGMGEQVVFRYSYFNLTDAPELLWTLHGVGFVVFAAMTVGLFTRVSTPLSLMVVLSYVHRAPLIAGQLEPVLTMLLFYLSLSPAGKNLSLDRLIWTKKTDDGVPPPEASWTANLGLRLIQVHLAGFYLMMGLSKLAGETWWDGTAVWWLIAHPESRIVDLTGLGYHPFVINFWTHIIVLFELAFALFVWNRWARPLLLLVAIPMWLSLAIVSAQPAFCLVMLLANLAFVPADVLRELLGKKAEKPAAAA
jgi:hypothetical protein